MPAYVAGHNASREGSHPDLACSTVDWAYHWSQGSLRHHLTHSFRKLKFHIFSFMTVIVPTTVYWHLSLLAAPLGPLNSRWVGKHFHQCFKSNDWFLSPQGKRIHAEAEFQISETQTWQEAGECHMRWQIVVLQRIQPIREETRVAWLNSRQIRNQFHICWVSPSFKMCRAERAD